MAMTAEERREYKAAYYQRYYAAHTEELKAYSRTYRAEHPAYSKAYNAAHKEQHREYAANERRQRPDRKDARAAVNNAVKKHRWPPANMQVCEICGEAQAQQYHHHLGYEPEHWLHTQAVCRECHGKAHRHVEEEG